MAYNRRGAPRRGEAARWHDGRPAAFEAGTPESAWVAAQLGRPVVRAFDNSYARHLMECGRPARTPDCVALPAAGDDAAA